MFTRFERTLACRYLKSPRQEGFISIIALFSFLGIALGVATLIIVMAVMNGFRQELLHRIMGMNGHIWIHRGQGSLHPDNPALKVLKDLDYLEKAIPLIDRQAILIHHGQSRGVKIRGLQRENINPLITQKLAAGTLDDFDQPSSILIGKQLADQWGLTVGDKLHLLVPQGASTAFGAMPRQKVFRVVALFDIGMHEYDKSFVFIPLSTAQKLFNKEHSVDHIELFIKNPDLSSQKASLLQATLGPSFRVFDWKYSHSSYFQAVQVERNVMFLILTLIILIAAFNIISSLIMLVKDKIKDIAILRTMGASQRSIMKIFFLTGASIGFWGTGVGVGLGLLFSFNIETIRQWLQKLSGSDLFQAEIYFLTQLPARVDLSDVISIIGLALSLSFLATLYPAWKASRLDPAEALRS